MSNLVIVENKKLFTTSLIIAEQTKNTVHSVRELIKKYKNDLEEFGVLSFEMRKPNKNSKGGRPQEIYYLNEEQTTLLLTFMRNSDIVIKFKKKLVKEFYKMKKSLNEAYVRKQNEEWKKLRVDSKYTRKNQTDIIKKFVEYATDQGSKSAFRYYSNISKMENKALFFLQGKFPNVRELMTGHQLMVIGSADQIVEKALIDGMDKKMFYKDIYKMAKERIEIFAEVMPKSQVPLLIEREGNKQ
jgi:phage regulator Rha-like protein